MALERNNTKIFGAVDWTSVVIYLALVLLGWLNIYAAVYDETHASIADLSQRYGVQMVWIGVSLFLGMAILLVDDKYYHMLAYPWYWIMLAILLGVAFFGREVKGARAWIMIGGMGIQPAEFMKFATALALARYMSSYSFSIRRMHDVLRVGLIIALPVAVILLQTDTGSAVVYGAFLFTLYREGMAGWPYVVLAMILLLFIFSFLLEPMTLLLLLIGVCAVGVGLSTGKWRKVTIYLSTLALGTILLFFGDKLFFADTLSAYSCLLICSLVSLVPVGVYAYRNRLRTIYMYLGLFCMAVAFTFTVDYVFDNVMQVHQQKRVLDLLGLESDLKGWGYNVNQSKIAIGSGGLLGKGFLEGTQTKYNFVPEQSTDFIFCTVGEEWGFVGSALVLALFCILILRLMRMGERQHEAFGRVYCYSVASIFLVHVLINVGMTVGLMPVIGIPLPFFSYGGSSMIAFTLLFFVAVKLDSTKRETAIYSIT